MIPKYRFWHITEKKMYEVLSIHLMTGMVEVEGGKYFLVPQDGFLMKFTGLFDKNGVEIYEEDVVSGLDLDLFREVGEVKFLSGCFAVIGPNVGLPLNDFDDVVVLGNIHEHPNLLEGGG